MKYLLLLMGSFEMTDSITSHFLVKYGLVQEGNPLLKSLITGNDFLMFKAVGVLACVLALWYLYQHLPKVSLIATSSIVLFYAMVIIWNLSVLLI